MLLYLKTRSAKVTKTLPEHDRSLHRQNDNCLCGKFRVYQNIGAQRVRVLSSVKSSTCWPHTPRVLIESCAKGTTDNECCYGVKNVRRVPIPCKAYIDTFYAQINPTLISLLAHLPVMTRVIL